MGGGGAGGWGRQWRGRDRAAAAMEGQGHGDGAEVRARAMAQDHPTCEASRGSRRGGQGAGGLACCLCRGLGLVLYKFFQKTIN